MATTARRPGTRLRRVGASLPFRQAVCRVPAGLVVRSGPPRGRRRGVALAVLALAVLALAGCHGPGAAPTGAAPHRPGPTADPPADVETSVDASARDLDADTDPGR